MLGLGEGCDWKLNSEICEKGVEDTNIILQLKSQLCGVENATPAKLCLTWSAISPASGKWMVFRHILVTMSSRRTTISCVQYCSRQGLLPNTAPGILSRNSLVIWRVSSPNTITSFSRPDELSRNSTGRSLNLRFELSLSVPMIVGVNNSWRAVRALRKPITPLDNKPWICLCHYKTEIQLEL
uniref:Uncharacterized protein n=2 Tax=Timema TaxID=61471 RepID=A0A7R9FIT3_9NEOP|nr:unnamed protein product [Timema tahoe]